jgi:hypothetical protein
METVILFTARFPLSREQRAVTDAVYNVSAPALRKTGKPYRVVEL